MSRNYRFHSSQAAYFVSFAVVEWIDVFTRNEYNNILFDSLEYCQKEKGMEIFAYCIMTNHVHLVFRSTKDQEPGRLLGDFKKFTSKAIIKAIKENPKESRKEWMINQFEKAGQSKTNITKYQFWRHDNKPIELWSKKVIDQKILYIHMNPVEQGLVARAEDYLYSSARDYCGETGYLRDVIVVG